MSLADACICVQKFHHDPEVHANIGSKIVNNNFAFAIFMNSAIWPKGSVINVSFIPIDEDYRPDWYTLASVSQSLTQQELQIEVDARKAPSYESAVKLIINQLVQPVVNPNVRFNFLDSGRGDVRVRFDKTGGSSSLIGTQCLQSPEDFTITFGWMDVGTIVHEFSHALGMLHEHQNSKGGIQWNRPAVYTWASQTQGWDKETTDVNILNSYPTNEISGSDYDPKSVMAYFFPADLTLNGESFTRNLRYSYTDTDWLKKKYDSNYAPMVDTSPDKPTSTQPGSSIISNRLVFILIIALAILVLVF